MFFGHSLKGGCDKDEDSIRWRLYRDSPLDRFSDDG